MRAPNLTAVLLGLASLASGAPTPQSTALQLSAMYNQPIASSNNLISRTPECTRAEPEKYIITVCGNGTDTNSLPHNELEFCVALSDGLAHQVTSTIQEANSICKFYDGSNVCNSDFLIATTTNRAQIPRSIGKRIKNVACWRTDGSLRGDIREIEAREDDAPLIPADGNVFAQPVESPALVSPVSNCLTPDARKNFLNICSEDSFGNAFPNNFIDKCVELSTHVAHHVTIIVQKPGLMCKFYDDSNGCHGNVRYISKTIDRTHRFEPPSEYGNDLKYALCRRGDWKRDARELEAREAGTHARYEDSPKPRNEIAARDEYASLVTIDTEVTTSTKKHMPMVKIYSSTTSMEINQDYANSCIKLDGHVAHDVKYTSQRHDVLCAYHANGCAASLKPLITVKPKGAGSLDQPMPLDIGNKITHVICGKWNGAGEMAMQHGPGGIHVREQDASFTADMGTAEESAVVDGGYATHMYATLPTLEWGQLRIGEDSGNTKLRKVVDALEGCVVFPASIYPDSTRFLEQSGRSECSFYTKAECTGDSILDTLNPDEADSQIVSEFAQQINAASCTILESIALPTTSTQTRSEPLPHVNAKDIRVAVGHSVSALGTPFLKVGDLYICSQPSLDPAGCTVLHTLNQCVAFPAPFAYQIKVITQAKGSFCKYYTKPGCMDGDEYFRYMSNPRQNAQLRGWGIEKLAGVWCGGTGASTADVNALDAPPPAAMHSSPTLPARSRDEKRGNPFYHWTTSPGSTTVCHQRNFAFCTNNAVNALQQCANFAPADEGPASAIQYKGAYCRWYTFIGCVGPWSILDSRRGDAYADGLLDGGKPRRYMSVKCETGPW